MTPMMMTVLSVALRMKMMTDWMTVTVKVQTCCSNKKNGTKYKKRKVPRIIRYVKYNKKKDPENYFREQLMLFVPWRNEQKDLIGSFDTYEAHYNSVQTSLISRRNELELARQMMEAEERNFDQVVPNAEQENREAEEEGSGESEKFVCFNPSRVVEQRHYDIGIELQSTCSVPPVETSAILLPERRILMAAPKS